MSKERVKVAGPLDAFRQFFSLQRDVLVLSLAMFAFSLGFQMTNRFLPDYLLYLGATGFLVGLFATLGNIIGAIFPYYGGVVSDRVGSRFALTVFGLLSTIGFGIWLVSGFVDTVGIGPLVLEPWVWVFVGLIFAQCWKSFGIGGHYAIVKQSVEPSRLARGFANRDVQAECLPAGPVDRRRPRRGRAHAGVSLRVGHCTRLRRGGDGRPALPLRRQRGHHRNRIRGRKANHQRHSFAARSAPTPPRGGHLRSVRQRNGVCLFHPRDHAVDGDRAGRESSCHRNSRSVAGRVLRRVAGSRNARRLGDHGPHRQDRRAHWPESCRWARLFRLRDLPVLFIFSPERAGVLVLLFAFSGLRFAGLPAHKALVVGPAEQGAGGRVTGSYYLVRNFLVIPSGALGGFIWEFLSPELSFTIASVVGMVGVVYFAVYGREFDAYA